MRAKITQSRMAATLTIVVLSCVALVTLPIAVQASNTREYSATVIAHLPLPGPSATQMLLQEEGSRLYLYVDQGETQGVAVIDVTSPSHPSVVNHVAWPRRVASGEVQRLGWGLALSETPGAPRAPQTVSVLDLTDPAHPQVLQTFSGVTSTLPDTSRNLIFIANAEGLWIVRDRVGQAAYAMRHRCTSEAAFNREPDCY